MSAGTMQGTAYYRCARAMTATPCGPRVAVTTFGSGRSVTVQPSLLGGLLSVPAAATREEWAGHLGIGEQKIRRLINAGVLLEVGSPIERLDADIVTSWPRPLECAFMQIMPGRSGPVPPVEPAGGPPCTEPVALPAPSRTPLSELLRRRRSQRRFSAGPLALEAVASLAWTATGRIGAKRDASGGEYLVTTAPSGGALQPCDLFAVARRVEGLAAGIYRYDNGRHHLMPVSPLAGDEAAVLTGSQQWGADAPLLLLFAPDLKIVTQRYDGPGVYINTLLEVGHRAQNVLLAGTELGLSGCMTGAVDRLTAATRLGLSWPWHAPVYTIAIGQPQ
jgi:SagB-type dehydrogenase family enzyme